MGDPKRRKHVRGVYNPYALTNYTPVFRPMPVPLVDSFDEPPAVCVRISKVLVPYLLGLLELYRWRDKLEGSPEQVTNALGVFQDLKAALMEGNCMMFQLRQNPDELCHLEQSLDGGATWQLAFDYSLCLSSAPTPEYRLVDGQLEESFDGGQTWNPVPPERDPRYTGQLFPEIEEAENLQCEAVNRIIETLKREFQSTAEDITAWATLAGLVTAFLKILAFVVPAAKAAAVFGAPMTAAASGAFAVGRQAFEDAFTPQVWEATYCALYCALSAGSETDEWTHGAFRAARSRIAAEVPGLFAPVHLRNVIDMMGPVGLTNAGRVNYVSLETEYDCDECDCPCEYELSPRPGYLAYITEPTLECLGDGWIRLTSGTWDRPGYGLSAVVDFWRLGGNMCFRPVEAIKITSEPTYQGWWINPGGTDGSTNNPPQLATNMWRTWLERLGDPTTFVIELKIVDC